MLFFQHGHEATPTLQQNQVVQQTQSVPQQVRYNSQLENLNIKVNLAIIPILISLKQKMKLWQSNLKQS